MMIYLMTQTLLADSGQFLVIDPVCLDQVDCIYWNTTTGRSAIEAEKEMLQKYPSAELWQRDTYEYEKEQLNKAIL